MNDDTRLHHGLMPGEDLQRPVAAEAACAPGANQAKPQPSSVYAALDLGTNNCRLLIACPCGDGFRVVDSFSRIIRLGEGVSATGCISEAAIERAIAALTVCRDKIESKRAKRQRLIATEACRAASNAEYFRDRVAAVTGIRLEVIDRETEAALAVIGCSRRLDRAGPHRTRPKQGACRAAHQSLDLDPARRRHPRRAFWRPRREAGYLSADG